MRAILPTLLFLVACTSESQPSFQCRLGELTGTWRATYTEQNGNCGEIPSETTVFEPGGKGDTKCTYATNAIAADKCSIEQDFTCPTLDNKGSQHWVGVLRQTGDTELTSSVTVQVDHQTLGMCRSTYAVTFTKL